MNTLMLCALMLSLQSPESARVEAPASVEIPEAGVEVPLLDYGGRPLVDARIEGQTFKLLLDTGSTRGLLLSPAACERLDVEREGGARFLVPTVSLGAAVFRDVPTSELDFMGGQLGVDGVLGLPCFEECLLTLDFPRKLVRLATGALEEGPEVVSFRRDEQMGFGITVDLDVAGVTVPAHLDTGSPEVVLFSSLLREELPLKSEPRLLGRAMTPMGGADVYSAPLDGDVKLGPIVVTRPDVRFADLPQIAGRRLGNVGGGLLRGACLTIDQAHGRLRLEPGTAEPASTPRRIGVQFRFANGEVLSVGAVEPGSAGELAGLLPDDRLLEIDGEAASLDALRASLAGAEPVVLVVERDGKRETLTLFARE